MVKRNSNNCCVEGCRNKQKDSKLSFFTLPKDSGRRNEWLNEIGRPDLLNKTEIKQNSYKVCSIHFESSMLSEVLTRKLLPGALPTKFLPNQPQPSTSKCGNKSNYSEISTQTKDSFIKKLSVVNIKKSSTAAIETQTYKPEKEKESQTTLALSSGTPRKRKLSAIVNVLGKKRRKLEIELDKIKKEKEAENSLSLTSPGNDDEDITERFYKLVQWQNSVRNKYKGNRYDPEFKFFALNLHFCSPQSYRSLKSLLKLPDESTLSRFKLNIRPELDDRIFNTISTKLHSLPNAAKYCTLCIDEMILKRHLYYDMKNDEIIGLHNINGNVTNEIVSNAYVIMLRGIFVNWKQPIGYALLASTKHYQELDDWMNEMMSKLFTLGIKVMAIVSNQGSNFDNYAKEIKQVTAEKPYFLFNENIIYYIFDVPQMLKCVRNNLLTNDFYYNENKISWDYIKTLYFHQKEQNLRLIPKVTDAHIEPNNYQKMRVKYATQIFSRSLYGALNTFIHAKFLPEEAKATAEFIKLMNDLFDVLNSSTIKSHNKYQGAFTLNKDQIEILNTAQNMFSKITAINRKNGVNNTNRIKTFKNFQITIQAVTMLSKDLKNEKFNFLFTRRLNQDPVEIFFRTIRQQGGNGKEPTPIQFKRAFSKLFLCNMLKKSASNNCEGDLFELLLKGNNKLFQETESIDKTSEASESSLIVSLDGEVDYRFDLPTRNAVIYVAGYLLFKCLERHQCSAFVAYFKNIPHLNDDSMFAHFKAYNKKSSFYGGLKVPPETFTNYIMELETTFMNNFEKIMTNKPANELLSLLKNVHFTTPCSCFPAQYLLKLFVRFRIFSTLKFNNRYFREGKKYIRQHIKVKQL